ncbi:MAG: phosphoribosyltransferase family protein, partial [Nanoarchaeota archaeon]
MSVVQEAFADKEIVQMSGYQFVINPLTEQIPCTTAELLQEVTKEIAAKIPKETTKLLTEEEKGAILVAATSLATKIPFGLARWTANGLVDQISVPFEMEYTRGTLYLNGVEKKDKVTIIEDMVSTGGTLVALIQAVEKAGAIIVKIITVAE